MITILNRDLRTKFRYRAAPPYHRLRSEPACGEGGHMGHEEIDTIIPALDELRAQGISRKVRCRQTPCSSRNIRSVRMPCSPCITIRACQQNIGDSGRAVNITAGTAVLSGPLSTTAQSPRNWQVPAKQMGSFITALNLAITMIKTVNEYTSPSGHFARKRFGQNFLTDQFIIDSTSRRLTRNLAGRLLKSGRDRLH